ncbi:MAG: ATP-dependent helicase HrpB [Alphaproteobacteria bacterium]
MTARPAFAPLPIDPALPGLLAALEAGRNAVLAAPPGAGKTTRVPLALLAAGWAAKGRILVLEPRRIAARAAAERMAELLGEAVGDTVGYRIRGERRVSGETRIEVVTEGILTRMLQSDPELPGIAAILFDEIHERSIHTDLGLALALEVQGALRPELRLLAMSATLDTGAVSRLMGDAPVIESAGRMFAVETRWLERPWARPAERSGGGRGRRFEEAAAELVSKALEQAQGDALVFLPGAGEINRVAALIARHHPDIALCPLYGALAFARQRAALRSDPGGRRKVVLATSIAETSLTVEGIGIVVDCGRARRARMNPGTGMSRLVTVAVSRAEADQRRGRAGRLGPGVCYRMWTRGEEGALPAFAPPEMLEADLAPLALELALWGVGDPAALAFLDPPPGPALTEARKLLAALGALDEAGRITTHGRAMAARPVHPRLAHMTIRAEAGGKAPEAALIAALLGERDLLRGPSKSGGRPPADLALRLAALADPKTFAAEHPFEADRGVVERIRAEARRLGSGRADPACAIAHATSCAGALLSLAYPDRVGLRRHDSGAGAAARYLLSGGRGAALAAGDPLAGQRLIVAADLEDTGREATVRLAAALGEADLRALHGGRIGWRDSAEWSPRTRQVEARSREMFGAIALADRHWRDAPPEALGVALAEGIRALGLSALDWSKAAVSLRARVEWLRVQGGGLGEQLPDWSDAGLLAGLDDWLTPHLAGMRRIEEAARLDLGALLRATLERDLVRRIERAAPSHFETPLGDRAAIDYGREAPVLSIRVQELFGVTAHPAVGDPPAPLTIELLSPARRPVQITRDLPGFWASSYAEVRKEMRARYPRHPWPEDPASAVATRRAKPRG